MIKDPKAPKLETMFLVIPPDPQAVKEVHPATLSDPPTLAELAAVVGPYLGTREIERVRVFTHFLADGWERYLDMFVDESSAQKRLKPNPVATRIYRNNVLKHEPNVVAETLPSVYGPAVLFRDQVWS